MPYIFTDWILCKVKKVAMQETETTDEIVQERATRENRDINNL
jgi:hypothetical protein